MHKDTASSQSTAKEASPRSRKKVEAGLEYFMFAGRWLQAPLFIGLTLSLLLYAYNFMRELWRLFIEIRHLENEDLLLGVLGLVDMTMVANLVYMVVLGGYSLFVSKVVVTGDEEDRPEWLDKTTAATLKIKLAASLVGVSGVHLLKTFIELGRSVSEHGNELPPNSAVMWQVVIHGVFLFTSVMLAISERILHPPEPHH